MLAIPETLAPTWSALPDAVRTYVAAYLGTAPASPAATVDPVDAPGSFADDLAAGGCRLRAAFPDLRRRVIAIEGPVGDRVAIRVACEGTHGGAFFGLMSPTGRRVRFDEHHELTFAGAHVTEDRLALDLRAVVRQLGSRPRNHPRAALGRRAVLAAA